MRVKSIPPGKKRIVDIEVYVFKSGYFCIISSLNQASTSTKPTVRVVPVAVQYFKLIPC